MSQPCHVMMTMMEYDDKQEVSTATVGPHPGPPTNPAHRSALRTTGLEDPSSTEDILQNLLQ